MKSETTPPTHLEFLVEEPSMEAFLRTALPRMIPDICSFSVHAFRGKPDLLAKLHLRLRGYKRWIPPNYRIVVLVDRDNQDCHALKAELESVARRTTLPTRSRVGGSRWRIANRIVIEELEAWYFGDWEAVCAAYPRVSKGVPRQARYRDPDAIAGGTWEAFERIMKRSRVLYDGLEKDRGGAGGRGSHPPRTQPIAEFSSPSEYRVGSYHAVSGHERTPRRQASTGNDPPSRID